MAPLDATVASALANNYRMIQTKVHDLVAPLSTEQIWRRPYHYGNSIGNLLLHLTGNLNYYIGAQIAATGYVRDRAREFSDTGLPKEQLLTSFDQVIDMVVISIQRQTAENWSSSYSAERDQESRDRFTAYLRCAGHAYHHVGQIIYLQKELTLPRGTSGD
jgi:uncharacterized damage-inducible protein DinB